MARGWGGKAVEGTRVTRVTEVGLRAGRRNVVEEVMDTMARGWRGLHEGGGRVRGDCKQEGEASGSLRMLVLIEDYLSMSVGKLLIDYLKLELLTPCLFSFKGNVMNNINSANEKRD